MRRFLVVVLLLGCVGLSACSWFRKKPPPSPPPKPPLCLELRAHPRLQWYQGSAHTLYVRLFPLTATDAFTSAETADLLVDPPPALPGSAGPPRSYVLYPGTSTKAEIETGPQEFPSLGIAAGYYKPLGKTKLVILPAEVPSGSCLTVNFGEAGIEGSAAPSAPGGK
jgi:type VI secretion system VasD/TssJ family lipoprotein